MSVINDTIGLTTFDSVAAAFAIIAINGGIAARVGPRKAKFSKATINDSLPGYNAIWFAKCIKYFCFINLLTSSSLARCRYICTTYKLTSYYNT